MDICECCKCEHSYEYCVFCDYKVSYCSNYCPDDEDDSNFIHFEQDTKKKFEDFYNRKINNDNILCFKCYNINMDILNKYIFTK